MVANEIQPLFRCRRATEEFSVPFKLRKVKENLELILSTWVYLESVYIGKVNLHFGNTEGLGSWECSLSCWLSVLGGSKTHEKESSFSHQPMPGKEVSFFTDCHLL
jgi:hypothetical protein